MILPSQRPIAASIASVFAVIPLLTMGTIHGKSQGVRNHAETDRQNRLEAVAKSSLSQNCYIVKAIVIGVEIPVEGRSQSVCIRLKDHSRYGFIEYQKDILTAIDAFSNKEVQSKISTLGAKKNASS